MALVSVGFELVVTWADTGDNRTTRTYDLVEAAYADAATDAAALIAAEVAISDAVVVGYGLKQKFLNNAFALPAAAEIENQAFFAGKINGDPTDSAILSVPAPKPAIFTAATGPGYNIVDMGNTLVNTFIDMFDTGGTAQLSDGETWDPTTVSGKRRHVKSFRG
jgi:hypothetical protein